MFKMDNLIKQLVSKLMGTPDNCIPESQMDKIREMFHSLPDEPQDGKEAPKWQKTTQRTDGQNGANSS